MGMRDECGLFLKALSEKIAEKQGESYQKRDVMDTDMIIVEIVSSVHPCIGSRVPFNILKTLWRIVADNASSVLVT